MKLGLCFLSLASSTTIGRATLNVVTVNDRHAGFKGELKVYLGRNCETNVETGRVCDYHYLQSITGLDANKEYNIQLSQDIDSAEDQLLMTYRSGDEAMFKSMKVVFDLYAEEKTVNLLTMKFGPGSNHNLAFDFDKHNHPCNSHYPRNTVCAWDQIFDLKTLTASRLDSLLSGHLDKSIDRPYDTPHVPPRMPGNTRDEETVQLKLTTGSSRDDGSSFPLNVYFGTKCNEYGCRYTKVAQIIAKDRHTEYSVWLPNFDPLNDQLLMDYRNSDSLAIDKLTFSVLACEEVVNEEACLATEYDLLKFGNETRRKKIVFDYQSTEQPCHTFSYGDHDCLFDSVWDFRSMTKSIDSSLFVGSPVPEPVPEELN